ncbi:hypothetical protein Dip510_001600 [Elusimicrobium posterum]|uniref:hypothetical protein n=1 Tax=Elusimicrobium posterum TaxID=3116653 RepID=UPI003C7269F4
MTIPDITLAPKSKGEVFYSFSAIPEDNPGSIKGWTGELQRPSDIGYSADFYNWLKNQHPELITTWADYQARIAANNSCSLYVLDYDTVAGSVLIGAIKFPTLSNYIRGPRGIENVSTELGDAIRNITGFWGGSTMGMITGKSVYTVSANAGIAGGNAGAALGLDTSKEVPTAEENRPKTQILFSWICIANAQMVQSVQFIPQEGPLQDISNLKASVGNLQGGVGFTSTGRNELKLITGTMPLESPELNYVAGFSSWAHGLDLSTYKINAFDLVLRCVNNDAASGYIAGDEIKMFTSQWNGTYAMAQAVTKDDTNGTISCSLTGIISYIRNKNTGGATGWTSVNNFKLVFKITYGYK